MQVFKRMSYFKKLLTSYIITIFVPAVIVSGVYFYYYSNQLKDGLEAESKQNLRNYSSIISTMTSEIDRLSIQFSFIPQLNKVLKESHYRAYDYSVLQSTMQMSILSNPLIHSVYLYTKINNKVLTTGEGIYSLDEFYDKSIVELTAYHESVSQRHEMHSIRKAYSDDELITFSRRLPPYSKDSLGILIFNINKRILFETAHLVDMDKRHSIFVLDGSSRIVYAPMRGTLAAELEKRAVANHIDNESTWKRLNTEEGHFFISSYRSPQLGWMLVQLIPYDEYKNRAGGKLSEMFTVILIVTALFIGLSYVLSVKMYVPFKQMVSSVADRLKFPEIGAKSNEMDFVEKAIDNILRENEQIKTSVRQNQPIIKERWVYDVLNQYIPSEDSFSAHKLEQLGIDFPHPHFFDLTVQLDLRTHSEREYNKIRLLIFSLVENAFQREYGIAGTILDGERFGFILNTEYSELNESLRKSLENISYTVIDLAQSELDVNLQFIFGTVYLSIKDMNESGRFVYKGLGYKAFINQVDVVFAEDFRNNDKVGYPSQYVNMMLMCIKSGDRVKTEEIVRQLFQTHVYTTQYSQHKLLEMLLKLLSVVIHELQREEDHWNEIPEANLLRIYEVHSKQELETFVKEFIGKLIDGLNYRPDDRQNVHIIRAVEFMKQNYRDNISISDIAEYLQISGSYLSRMFKAELGKSPLEFLTEYRMERGKEYLKDSRLSLQEISLMIGYNDSHSFIRQFKKYAGSTPGEYRNWLMKNR